MILVKDSAPTPSSLGATNGLAQFAMVSSLFHSLHNVAC